MDDTLGREEARSLSSLAGLAPPLVARAEALSFAPLEQMDRAWVLLAVLHISPVLYFFGRRCRGSGDRPPGQGGQLTSNPIHHYPHVHGTAGHRRSRNPNHTKVLFRRVRWMGALLVPFASMHVSDATFVLWPEL